MELIDCYDIIIIGGGPAGLTAGIYACRARLKTLLLERMVPGGRAFLAERIENYPGFPDGISGPELAGRMEEQAKKSGLEIVSEEVIGLENVKCEVKNGKWEVKTRNKQYSTLAVIIATGTQPARLNIPGEEEFQGKGVYYCATCDGPLFRDREVLVVGGGDTAITEALFLAKFASKVTIIHRRDKFSASRILQEKVLSNPRIEFVWNSVITEIVGKEGIERVKIKDIKTDEQREIKTSGLFISIGLKPNTSFLKDLINLDMEGFIITDTKMQASRGGIYAAGDVRSRAFRQVATACGDGAIASLSAQHYVEGLKK